ncbi:MAG: chorismate synthase [Bacteroidota bacterium]|nr:chorismate synthase [Bacteroidota bacterium]
MSGNTIGTVFRLTSFGESHGPAIGGILEGCPSGLAIDTSLIQQLLDRRKPGQSDITSPRKEADTVELLSGIHEGFSIGTPIGFIIRNSDARSEDYDHLKNVYRPSHADYTWEAKYGLRDHRGGGRASARETACRVVAGAIALQLLKHHNITVSAWVSAVGAIEMPEEHTSYDASHVYENEVRCPHPATAVKILDLIKNVKEQGDSVGGIVSCTVTGVPAGLGEPVFDKLHASLGAAMLSINAVKGFETGSGFQAARMKGSEHNDPFRSEEGEITTTTNNSGGIQGGISNGRPVNFRVAFKPVATIKSEQQSVNTSGENISFAAKGRHDPCVVPRAVPIVEAMAAIIIADHLLRNRLSKL